MNQDLSGAASPTVQSDESSVSGGELRKIDAYWRACNYLSLGMLYLSGNPLLREPLQVKHIKERLIGHWGSDPGQSFIRVHLNRLIKKYDLNMIYVAGPGHGAPATLANSYLEGRYSEVYRDMSENEEGMARLAEGARKDQSNSGSFRSCSSASIVAREPGFTQAGIFGSSMTRTPGLTSSLSAPPTQSTRLSRPFLRP
jgi:phosphoketolase